MNDKNLIPFQDRTEDEQRAIATRGGKASGEARRRKKMIRDCMEALLKKSIATTDGKTMSGAEAICLKQFQKALKGDAKAFELIWETSGQKMMLAGDIGEIGPTQIIVMAEDNAEETPS